MVGHLVGVRYDTSTHGEYPVLTLRLKDTEELWSIWVFWDVLACQIASAAPALGSMMGVRYDGHVHKSESGKSYHRFTVLAEEPVEGDRHDSLECMGQHKDEHDIYFRARVDEIRQGAADDEENKEGDWKPFD